MKIAIKKSIKASKGIYLMKALAGGHLIDDALDSFRHVLDFPGISSIAVGMKNIPEIDYNIEVFSSNIPNSELTDKVKKINRKLFIHDWCTGCGNCINACKHGALKIENNVVVVNNKKCILCGYCADKCKDFCIKVI